MNAENQHTENHRTTIEKIMMGLPAVLTKEHHKQYLAGHIDCLESLGEIDQETHETLYTEFVG